MTKKNTPPRGRMTKNRLARIKKLLSEVAIIARSAPFCDSNHGKVFDFNTQRAVMGDSLYKNMLDFGQWYFAMHSARKRCHRAGDAWCLEASPYGHDMNIHIKRIIKSAEAAVVGFTCIPDEDWKTYMHGLRDAREKKQREETVKMNAERHLEDFKKLCTDGVRNAYKKEYELLTGWLKYDNPPGGRDGWVVRLEALQMAWSRYLDIYPDTVL